MNETLVTREQEVLNKLKRKYVELGYDFIEQPSRDQIPDFLANARPDAIATRGAERIVFEVMTLGSSASSNVTAKYLALEIPKHPGWKFELVLTETNNGIDDATFDLGPEDFKIEFGKIERLIENHELKSAIVTGWGLLESLKRFLTAKPDAAVAKRYRPRTVIESLVSEGYLQDSEGEELDSISVIRNRLVHGFSKVEVSKSDAKTLANVLRKLIDLAENDAR